MPMHVLHLLLYTLLGGKSVSRLHLLCTVCVEIFAVDLVSLFHGAMLQPQKFHSAILTPITGDQRVAIHVEASNNCMRFHDLRHVTAVYYVRASWIRRFENPMKILFSGFGTSPQNIGPTEISTYSVYMYRTACTCMYSVQL